MCKCASGQGEYVYVEEETKSRSMLITNACLRETTGDYLYKALQVRILTPTMVAHALCQMQYVCTGSRERKVDWVKSSKSFERTSAKS